MTDEGSSLVASSFNQSKRLFHKQTPFSALKAHNNISFPQSTTKSLLSIVSNIYHWLKIYHSSSLVSPVGICEINSINSHAFATDLRIRNYQTFFSLFFLLSSKTYCELWRQMGSEREQLTSTLNTLVRQFEFQVERMREPIRLACPSIELLALSPTIVYPQAKTFHLLLASETDSPEILRTREQTSVQFS